MKERDRVYSKDRSRKHWSGIPEIVDRKGFSPRELRKMVKLNTRTGRKTCTMCSLPVNECCKEPVDSPEPGSSLE